MGAGIIGSIGIRGLIGGWCDGGWCDGGVALIDLLYLFTYFIYF